MPELREAVIDREDHRVTIHVGHLSIEINKSPQHDGPLGFKEQGGRSPGVIFWKNETVVANANDGYLEFGGGPRLASENMDKMDVERILENLKEETHGEGDS